MTSEVSLLNHLLAVVPLGLEKAGVRPLGHSLAVLSLPSSSDHIIFFSHHHSPLLTHLPADQPFLGGYHIHSLGGYVHQVPLRISYPRSMIARFILSQNVEYILLLLVVTSLLSRQQVRPFGRYPYPPFFGPYKGT